MRAEWREQGWIACVRWLADCARRAVLAVAIALAIGVPAPPTARANADAAHVLEVALAKRYQAEFVQRITIEVSGPSGALGERKVEVASKRYGGQVYVLGRFTEPTRMRGTAFLAIEHEGASDYFVYLPAFGRVRRVSAYQRSDPWFETDLSFEDVERHRTSDYQVVSSQSDSIDAESVLRIETEPRYESSFDRVVFFVATEDSAILRVEYRNQGSPGALLKEIDTPRSRLIARGDALLPGFVRARTPGQGSQTVLEVEEVVFDPDLQKRFFNAATLEMRSKLPFAQID
jgi:hypothetical protein